MTKRASQCDQCTNWTGTLPCRAGHRPRHYVPRSPVDDEWGWKRRCADFYPSRYTRAELDEAKAEAAECEQAIRALLDTPTEDPNEVVNEI